LAKIRFKNYKAHLAETLRETTLNTEGFVCSEQEYIYRLFQDIQGKNLELLYAKADIQVVSPNKQNLKI
jgi:hypothetical protein